MKANSSVAEIARTVQSGTTSAGSVVEASLARIAARNGVLGAFTDVMAERAIARAAAVDAQIRSGTKLPLAGVPFAVKNLFDLKGVVTLAGSKINRDNPPATGDAALVERLEAAGAVCVGAVNMGEYAYDFTGENAHDGPSRNPHNLEHMTGGSSGGSGAAVAGGLVPISLASDTNGSIRVPASLCGLFGLKPTYGRLSRHGAFPFVAALDHLGPLARSVEDLALTYDALQGYDERDPAQAKRPVEAVSARLDRGAAGLRVAVADGFFAAGPDVREAVSTVARALETNRNIALPHATAARAAAFLITMAQGGNLHLERLRQRAGDFDPDVRDRLLAGNMLPASWVERAQRFRRVFREEMLRVFDGIDVIIAPATPMRAPRLGQKTAMFGGVEMPVRPNLGMFTQPFSFIGLPVVAVPLWLGGATLPIGVQLIAAPWREDNALRAARQLEKLGVASAPVAAGFIDD